MSHAVWRFDLSVPELVSEFRDILQRSTPVQAIQVRSEWAFRAQLVLEPAGWDALWRLPRDTCQQLGVRFPCVVYVTVEELNLESVLSAEVEVIGVQEEKVHLPARHCVPLQQLWPLKQQPNTAIDYKPTAYFIHLYRYFYTQIWLPWDLDGDESGASSGCWFARNVETRCSMWAQGCGSAPPELLTRLIQDAQRLQQRISEMEDTMPSDTDDDFLDCSKEDVSKLVQLYYELQQVRLRWEALQNPALRRFSPDAVNNKPLPGNPQRIIVWTGGPLESHVSCLEAAKRWLTSHGMSDAASGADVGCAPSLQSALRPQRPPPSSVIMLCRGKHFLPADTHLGDDYTIAAVTDGVSITCPEARATALPISGSTVLTGVEVNCGDASTGVAVRAGTVQLKNCCLATARGSPSQAVLAHRATQLKMTNCYLKGFYTGVVAHANSQVELEDCILEDCGVMLQIYEGARLSMTRCTFKGFSEAAIRYQTTLVTESSKGSTDLLGSYSDITITDCMFSESDVSQVFIAPLDEHACPEIEGEISNF